MRRREFIKLFRGAAVAWPLTARAQQLLPVIGYLSPGSPEADTFRLARFRQGLNETGYVEGENVAIEPRWSQGQNDRLPALAADLVRLQVLVIVAAGAPPAFAAKVATSVIPIVFVLGIDPVQSGGGGAVRLDAGTARRSAPWPNQPPGLAACCTCRARFIVA
jgi:putative ABC transport system substrate-binding protein